MYNRKAIRLPKWDYASAGLYYVTVVTWERIHHFGTIRNNAVLLSDAGRIADTVWNMIPTQFPHTSIDQYVIMPNHIHGIIRIHERARRVGIYADRAKHDADRAKHDADRAKHDADRAKHDAYLPTDPGHVMHRDGLEKIVRWYKGRTTFAYHGFMNHTRCKGGINAAPTHGSTVSLWQRSFYDHIIRNDVDVNRIREYIQSNPANWATDKLNT